MIAGQWRKCVDPLTLRPLRRRSQKDAYDTRVSVGIKLKRVRREVEANVIALPDSRERRSHFYIIYQVAVFDYGLIAG